MQIGSSCFYALLFLCCSFSFPGKTKKTGTLDLQAFQPSHEQGMRESNSR